MFLKLLMKIFQKTIITTPVTAHVMFNGSTIFLSLSEKTPMIISLVSSRQASITRNINGH